MGNLVCWYAESGQIRRSKQPHLLHLRNSCLWTPGALSPLLSSLPHVILALQCSVDYCSVLFCPARPCLSPASFALRRHDTHTPCTSFWQPNPDKQNHENSLSAPQVQGLNAQILLLDLLACHGSALANQSPSLLNERQCLNLQATFNQQRAALQLQGAARLSTWDKCGWWRSQQAAHSLDACPATWSEQIPCKESVAAGS